MAREVPSKCPVIPRGGTCQNLDRDARPTFWVWNLAKFYFSELEILQLFFWVSQNFRYFLGSDKFPAIFGSSNFCITHLSHLNEEHTVLKNIKS